MTGDCDFEAQEYAQRYERARSVMQEQGLDALLITERTNYIYFTGHRSQQNPIDKIRPYIFILPVDADGAILTADFELEQIRTTTWVDDVRVAPLTGYTDVLAETIKSKGLESARIGAELGRGQYLGMSYLEFNELRKILPHVEFADSGTLLHRLRAVKSSNEVQYMRTAAEITARAIADTYSTVTPDMTERDVMRTLRSRLADHGGENVTFMWIVNSLEGMVAIATDRKLRDGGLLTLDLGIEYRGYCSDIARSASIGDPSETMNDFYTWMLDLRDRCVDRLRVGGTAEDVIATCNEGIAEKGLSILQAGRIGHGVGLESTEFPSLGSGAGKAWPGDDETTFQPGMVFACNPSFTRDFGWMNIEDEWLITSDGPQLLSTPYPQRHLPVIS